MVYCGLVYHIPYGEITMKHKPFIHCFKTYSQYYFYDFNTNAIVRVPEDIYGYLADVEQNGYKDCANSSINDVVCSLQEQGFLSEHHWRKIEHPATKFLDTYLQSSVESLTLQVTQQCNLKCEYCPYSGSFYNRQHSNKRMSFETAKKAVDFYFSNSYDMPIARIGFYGGEPLIEFELINSY